MLLVSELLHHKYFQTSSKTGMMLISLLVHKLTNLTEINQNNSVFKQSN